MITKEAIHDEVVRVLRHELLFSGELSPDTAIQALGLDSIQLMQLFVYIEEAFHFEFDAESTIENAKNASLGQFVDFVHQSVARAG